MSSIDDALDVVYGKPKPKDELDMALDAAYSKQSSTPNAAVEGIATGLMAGAEPEAFMQGAIERQPLPPRQPAPVVEPDLNLMQSLAYNPVVNAVADIQNVSPEAQAVAQQARNQQAADLAGLGSRLMTNFQTANQNLPVAATAAGVMLPEFATQVAGDIANVGTAAIEPFYPEAARRARSDIKLAQDTAKATAMQAVEDTRQAMTGKSADVTEQLLAEELAPQKKQGAFAKAQRALFLHQAETMPPDQFKTKYPEALPIDTFNAKFEEVLADQTMPQTVKSFFYDMPLESVKTVYGAIAGDPEVSKRFNERPYETIMETAIGLGIGANLKNLPRDIKKMRTFAKEQTPTEKAESFMESERQTTDFLRKQNDMRDQMRNQTQTGYTPEEVRTMKMTQEQGKGMTADEMADTVRVPTESPTATVPPEVLAEYPDLKPRPKTGPGMFGGATVQNLYEQKVEPAINNLFKKRDAAYGKNTRNADITRDKGRVVDLTEVEGKPVETEAPLRKFLRDEEGGLDLTKLKRFITGEPDIDKLAVTVGDPALAKEIETMFKNAQAKEMKAKQQAMDKAQTQFSAAKQSMLDLFSPVIDRVKDPKEKERVMALVHDIFYLSSNAEGLMRGVKNTVYDKLAENDLNHGDYSAYIAAKAATTFRQKVKSFKTPAEAQTFLDSIDPVKRKVMEDIQKDFHEKEWKPLLQELKDSGLGDPLIINKIMNNENYTTFFPADMLGLDYGEREYTPSAGVFKLKGSEGDILDPQYAQYTKGIKMLTAAIVNRGKLAARDAMPGEFKQAPSKFKGYRKEKVNGVDFEIPMFEFAEPPASSNMALMKMREGGKVLGYYVPKEIARAFDMSIGGSDTLGHAMKFWHDTTKAFRNVWIEYNPAWQVMVNAPRDIATALIEMPKIRNKFTLAKNIAKVAPAAVGDYIPVLGEIMQKMFGMTRKQFDDLNTKMLKEGKILSTRESQYMVEGNITPTERMLKTYGQYGKEQKNAVKRGLDIVQEFGKDIERMTKVAAEMTLEESQKKGRTKYSDEETRNIIRRIGSPAFGVRGGGMLFDTVKTATMFYNATKEGWRAADYFLRKDPVGFIASASVPLGLFAATVAMESGKFGTGLEEAYSKMNKYDKESGLTIPLWYSGNGEINYLKLPMPQILKPFMGMIRAAAKKNPDIVESMVKGFSDELPMMNPIMGLFSRLYSYGDEETPTSSLTRKPIMPPESWKAGGMEKATKFGKAFWNDFLLGSQFRLKVFPGEKDFTPEERLMKMAFGKVLKSAYALKPEKDERGRAQMDIQAQKVSDAETKDERNAALKDLMQMSKENKIPVEKGKLKGMMMNKLFKKMKTDDPEKAMLIQTLKRKDLSPQEKLDLFMKVKKFKKNK